MGGANTNIILAVAGLGGLVVVALIVALLVSGGAKKKQQAWTDLATAGGLRAEGTYPLMALAGSLDGITVGLRHVQEMVNKSGHGTTGFAGTTKPSVKMTASGRPVTRTTCKAHAAIPGGTGDLEVAEETLMGKLSKLVGAQDHKTGDSAFDKRFTVRSATPETAVAHLTPPARAALMSVEDRLRGEITIEGGAVRWEGGSVSAERGLEIVRALADTARAFKA